MSCSCAVVFSHSLFVLMLLPPPPSTLFPYTTLFRSRAAAEPVHRSKCQTDDEPDQMEVREAAEKRFEILAEEDEDDDDAEEGDDGEQLEAAPQQPRGEGERHGWGETTGARDWGLGTRVSP